MNQHANFIAHVKLYRPQPWAQPGFFSGGGGTLIQKNIQKIFKKFLKNLQKNFQKFSKNFQKYSKKFKKNFFTKMLKIDF